MWRSKFPCRKIRLKKAHSHSFQYYLIHKTVCRDSLRGKLIGARIGRCPRTRQCGNRIVPLKSGLNYWSWFHNVANVADWISSSDSPRHIDPRGEKLLHDSYWFIVDSLKNLPFFNVTKDMNRMSKIPVHYLSFCNKALRRIPLSFNIQNHQKGNPKRDSQWLHY